MNTSAKTKLIILLLTGCFIRTDVFAQYLGQTAAGQMLPSRIQPKAYSFNLADVKLLNSRFTDNMKRNGAWLLSLNNDRLLHSWRVNAGMLSRARPLGGWEGLDVELRGHTLGHVLSGLSQMYASTGDTAYKQKADSLVNALAQIQSTLNEGGYLSAFPQNLIDRAIAGNDVWAPWYTIHKLMAGLIDMYQYAGNKQALNIAVNMSNWAYHKLDTLSLQQLATMHKAEFGGMMETAYNLYAITGNDNDRKLARFFYDHRVLDPLAGKRDSLNQFHANTQIPKIIGEARGYELTGNDSDKTIAGFFWQEVVDHHTYATGGNSDYEVFFEPDAISKHISRATTESCNTYNMLKLTRHLFTWTADAKYADYYERALYNHILATQERETGMVTYYVSYTPGSFKTYSDKDDSYWCCVGTGFENGAKYGEGIYYHNDKGIYVNLFIPSQLTWKEKGVTLLQETNYPEEETTHLTITEAGTGEMPLYIRYPSWATSGAAVLVNGKKVSVSAKPGSYMVLNRLWKKGDKIEVTYPMSLRMVRANDDPNVAAVAYGPLILAGDADTEGMTPQMPFAGDAFAYKDVPVPADIDTVLSIGRKKLSDYIVPVAGKPLTFKVAGTRGKDITLIPFDEINRQRYVLYWHLQ